MSGPAVWASSFQVPLAAATQPDFNSLVLVLGASSLGVILSRFHRRVALPSVVAELVLGILIGPQVLGWAKTDTYIVFLADFGLVFLFFFAGLEVIEKHVPRQAVARGSIGWMLSLAIGTLAGLVLHEAGVDAAIWLLAVALSTTALGTLVPILSDAGLLPTPLGTAVLGTGVAGEFWPIVIISVFLTGVYGAVAEVLLLLAFSALVLLAATVALRARPPRMVRIMQETVHTTGQAAVRLSVFLLAVLVLIAHDVGFDFVLGAFASGLIVGLALDTPAAEPVRMRLEGIGFGLLIPIYFVVTGMEFDLDSLLTADGLLLAALFLVLFVVTRGAAALLWWRELGSRATLSLALFGATGLPLIVAVVGLATDRGAVGTDVGASLIGAGTISVLVLPVLGTALAGPHLAKMTPAALEAEGATEY